MTKALRPDPISYPPRGMPREEAARYIGFGTTKFDEMVEDGRMPKPKRVDGRVVWDRLRLDAAFTDLPDEKRINPLDRMFQSEADRKAAELATEEEWLRKYEARKKR